LAAEQLLDERLVASWATIWVVECDRQLLLELVLGELFDRIVSLV
jgi:hypothetical protein